MPKTLYHDDERLPEFSVHWVCVGLIADRLVSRSCSPADVTCDLQAVLQRGLVRSKLQACSESRQPDKSEWGTLQLAVQDSAESWLIEITQDGEPFEANLYLWLPDCDRLWFCLNDSASFNAPLPDREQSADSLPTTASPETASQRGGRPTEHLWEDAACEVEAWIEKVGHSLDRHPDGRPIIQRGIDRMLVGFKKLKDPKPPSDRQVRDWITNHSERTDKWWADATAASVMK